MSLTTRIATATASTLAAVVMLPSPALAAGARFLPEATDAGWDGAVATVTFQEVEVAVDGGITTISVQVTADVTAVCTRGESTVEVRRSATALAATDYPIDEEGVVAGTATLPLRVSGVKLPGFTCVAQKVSLTAVLEDFWTGATLTHRT